MTDKATLSGADDPTSTRQPVEGLPISALGDFDRGRIWPPRKENLLENDLAGDWWLYSAVVQSISDPVITRTLDGRITGWNRAAERLFGFSADEAIGQSIAIIAPAGLHEEVNRLLERSSRGENIDHYETVRRAKDGKLLDVRLSISPIKTPSGEVIGAAQFVRDITEQRSIERRFQIVVEACPSGLLMIDASGSIALVNAELERQFGYDRSELVGRNVDMLLPTRLCEAHAQHREQFRNRPSTRSMGAGRDLYGRRKDGSEFPVEIGLNPIAALNGQMVMATVIDITARKEAERGFQIVVEACPSGLLMIDASGSIMLVNAELERQFGYDRSELIGTGVEVLLPAPLREAHVRLRTSFGDKPAVRVMGAGRDLYGRRKDGSEFPVEIGLNPITALNRAMVLATVVDITARKQAENAVEAQNEQLRRSNAELEQFAYIASHDLQEPLRMVASFTQLLEDRYGDKLDNKASKYIGYAVEGAKRMQNLVRDLLTYSRVTSTEKILKPVDSAAVVAAVLLRLGALIKENGAKVNVHVLPVVMSDDLELGQVFQNLIGNAVKFRAPDRAPRIEIAAERRQGMWQFAVTDNGIGIDERFSERIFQMFQRLHERSKYEGSGIGLAIAKKIVERHGGRIWFVSVLGQGTTFHFSLPAQDQVQ